MISKYLPAGLLLAIILCSVIFSAAQQPYKINIVVAGEILDVNGVGITDCTVKISGVKSHLIYSYFSVTGKNTFSAKVSLSVADSLSVTISHIGYADTILKCAGAITGEDCELNAVLKYKTNTLKEVIVNAPRIWRRGDTTFYRTDAFKEGNEQKLKDLIIKIPGFEITEDGRLLYQHKDVTKLLINGNELFEDKVKLLLDNFPVHVLKTIQAIENQKASALLKGMKGGNETFVNLELNKKNKPVTFGDTKAGAGTSDKYEVNTTLFSLLKKTQFGFIGNWNNTGNGVGWQEENELKNNTEQWTEKWLMNYHPLQHIPDFENRWYVSNGQWDNRLQINVPVSEKLKAKTEVNFVNDRQLQNTYYASSLYDGSKYVLRNDTNDFTYKPTLLSIKQSYDLRIDSVKSLTVNAGFFNDFSKGQQYSIYNQVNNASYLQSGIANNWKSFTASAVYTQRVSGAKATQLFINFNHQNMAQEGIGLSPEWAKTFALDSEYSLLQQKLINHFTNFNALWVQQKDAKKSGYSYTFFYDVSDVQLQSGLAFSNEQQNLPKLKLENFNNSTTYKIYTISTSFNGFRSLGHASLISFQASMEGKYTSVFEHNEKQNFATPEYSIKADYNASILKKFQSSLSFYASQHQVDETQLYGVSRPASISTFQRYANIQLPLRDARVSYNLGWYWPNSLSTGSFGFNYINNFTSFASDVSLNNFVAVSVDSMVKRNTSNFNVFTSHELPVVFLMAIIKLDAGYGENSFLLSQNGLLLKARNASSFFKIAVKKNLHKKYFITLQSNLIYTRYKAPSAISGSISPDVFSIKSTFNQLLTINKNINVSLNTSLFNQNLFTPKNSSFVFVSAELNVKPKKQPFYFSLRGENLTNQKFYYSSFNSYLYQSFYTVPLIPLRAFISIKYNL